MEIACRDYAPLPGTKRCTDYQAGGTCARPDRFVCEEWARANGYPVVTPSTDPAPGATASSGPAEVARSRPRPMPDLFGHGSREPSAAPAREPVSPASPPKPRMLAPASAAPSDPATHPATRGLTTADIEAFKALGVEVCLCSDTFGEVWLVPQRTGKARTELTPENAATVCRVIDALPGARVTTIHPIDRKQEARA